MNPKTILYPQGRHQQEPVPCDNEFCENKAVEEYCGLNYCYAHYLILLRGRRGKK